MSSLLKKITCFLLIIFVVTSCKKNANLEERKSIYTFNKHVTAFTKGTISTNESIKVSFAKPIHNWATFDINKNDFTISPKVEGEVKLINASTLVFKPTSPLKSDAYYTLSLKVDKFQKATGKEKNFIFDVKTIDLNFRVTLGKIQSNDDKIQYLTGTIIANDIIDSSKIEKLISVKQNDNQELYIKWDKDMYSKREFPFIIENIKRFDEDSKLFVSWDGSSYDIDAKGERELLIAGKNNFKILSLDVSQVPNQHIIINFSDPLDKNQNFNGLIDIPNALKLKYLVEGNLLKVYPTNEIKGTQSIKIAEGIKNTTNYSLKHTYEYDIHFEQLKPEIQLLGNGVVIPDSKNLKLNFKAVNLKSIDVRIIRIYENNVLQFLQNNDLNSTGKYELKPVGRPVLYEKIDLGDDQSTDFSKWNNYSIDLASIIEPEMGAIYNIDLRFKKSYAKYVCEGEGNTEEDTDTYNENEEKSFWNNENYYNDYYYYDWNNSENPCTTDYYNNERFVSTNLLATELGAIIKKGVNKSYFVAVSNLLTTSPESEAKVTLFNFQKQIIGTSNTDANGITYLDVDEDAYFAIIEKNNQATYVKLQDGNSLSLSKFNVDGSRIKKGLKGYIYGDRGVWRPGDSIYLNFVLNDKTNKIPENHPIKFELTDPNGTITQRIVSQNGLNKVYSFKTKTSNEAPTGNWNAKISVGGAAFNKTIKVETIKPNRLKIKNTFENNILTSEKEAIGNLQVNWLHGAVAKNLKAEVVANIRTKKTEFENFPSYTFDDPARYFKEEQIDLFEGELDEEGKTTYSFEPELEGKASGLLNTSFITTVYEKGGDMSINVTNKVYSPYKRYIGVDVPKDEENYNYLDSEQEHTFDIVSVDDQGNPIKANNLEIKIYEINWRWWWNNSSDNLANYINSTSHTPVLIKKINTDGKGKASFKFKQEDPHWGRFLIRVKDPKHGHAAGETFYMGWTGSSPMGDPSSATMLSFSTNKTSYKTGETATVTFNSSSNGNALLSIENGTEIIDSHWIKTEKGKTTYSFEITKDMTPNVYLSIHSMQPHYEKNNDLPIRMYGVSSIEVIDPKTKLSPEIEGENVLKPESETTLSISEKDGKEMTYTISIVDEGLLDLTNFKTPNPWNRFFSKEALGVKTWDMYDYVLGAFGGRIDQVFSIGGDESASVTNPKKANRFKPMVVHLGPFNLNAGETKFHKIKIPKYIGSVRTMVVASNPKENAYGCSEKTSSVRKPLMVMGSLARKLTPGEKVTLPVTVFAMEEKIKNVKVSLKSNDAFKVTGNPFQTISFNKPDEKLVYFQLEVLAGSAIGKIEILANGNGEKASYPIEIDVLNPNPISTESMDYKLDANKQHKIDFTSFGVKGTNSAVVEFSTLPPIDFDRRLKTLIGYPHGCVEQTTSKVFPQLFLMDIFDLDDTYQFKIDKNIKAGIERLQLFQLSSGGFSYWPGGNYANEWGTNYAGNFLLEAEKLGYAIPIGFKSKWISFQQEKSKNYRNNSKRDDLIQAYRLYTLALANAPDLSSMNRLKTQEISNEARLRLAAAYALIGQRDVAKKLLDNSNLQFENTKRDYYSYGSKIRNIAMAVETCLLTDKTKEAQKLVEEVASNLGSKKWFSTQTTAYGLISIAKYLEKIGGTSISVTLSGVTNGEYNSNKGILQIPISEIQEQNSLEIKNLKNNLVFVRLNTYGKLAVGKEKVSSKNFNLTIKYEDTEGNSIDVSQLRQGKTFTAEYILTNNTDTRIENIALTGILTSGWEIMNTRFTDSNRVDNNKADYIDIRDDRTNFYFDLKGRDSKTFKVLLNASYLGRYYLPGGQAEAMYDGDYYARTRGQWIEVVN